MTTPQATGVAAGPPVVRMGQVTWFDESMLEPLQRFAGDHEWWQLGRAALDRHEYAQAEDAFRSGLDYCELRGLTAWEGELTAGLAESLVEQVRYDEADVLLQRLRPGALDPATRGALSAVSGRAAAQRTGDHRGLLDEARSLAEHRGNDRLMVQVACARAEAAWITARTLELRAEAHRGWQLASERGDPWALGELSWWLLRAGSPPARPGPVAAPFRSMLDGDWAAAATAWQARGRLLWAAYALGRSGSLADVRRAVSIGVAAGATAAVQAVLRERRGAGLPVPPQPRSATRANPLCLTPRELEVLGLLADGLTNAQIATRLYLSARTVAHHVSAVLQKLGQPNRSAAVATAVRHGILPTSRQASVTASTRPVTPIRPTPG